VFLHRSPREGGEEVIADYHKKTWVSFAPEADRVSQWATTDGFLVAALYTDGCIQFAYAPFLKSKGLLIQDPPENESAPVEDTFGGNTQKSGAPQQADEAPARKTNI
jgi:hypothetical protein